jgi:hypothetical protein
LAGHPADERVHGAALDWAGAGAAGATGEILVRGDSAYGTSAVVSACLKARVRFSVVLTKNPAVARAIDTIADAWTPVHYPGAATPTPVS